MICPHPKIKSAKRHHMNTNDNLKDLVRRKYAEIASQDKATNASSCCGAGGCSTEVYNIMTDDYAQVEGYVPDADLGLGCGLPTEHAGIRPGHTVLDLGSGAGNDCFVARNITGPDGRVIGVDFTPEMIAKAKENAQKLGFQNVEFRQGDIEKLPLSACMVDVVVSNCVLNLVPDKKKAFSEVLRVLRPGGHFSISDVVLNGELPEKLKGAAEMYAGCVSGALQEKDYLRIVEGAGFEDMQVRKRKPIIIPDDILGQYLTAEEIVSYKQIGSGIFSITLYAHKPMDSCCAPETTSNKKDTGLEGCDLGVACC